MKATAEGEAQQAQQEATIRVEQSKIQETTRQQIVLAALEEERLKAQLNVIEAEKANSLLSAQRDLEIYQAQAAAAIEKARADLAKELALAEIYTNNPNYYLLQIAMVNASAIKDTDKIIFTPEGVFPSWCLGIIFCQRLQYQIQNSRIHKIIKETRLKLVSFIFLASRFVC